MADKDFISKVVRSETKVSYVIITVLLCILSLTIGRETVSGRLDSLKEQVALLEKGRALNELAIKTISSENDLKMQVLLKLQSDVGDIKTMFAAHTGQLDGKND